jgi:uncharacterized membrane protein YsdA (DUF1294 family)
MTDQQITCAECGRRFTWSAGEQQFYRERGLQTPRRCEACRGARRQQAVRTPAAPRAAPQPSRPVARRQSPRRAFGIPLLIAAAAIGVVLLLVVRATPLLSWLAAINLVTLAAYGYDKQIAGGGRVRVPEAVLLGLALIGGSPAAAAAILLLRHKSSKPAFLVPFALMVLLQLGLIAAWPLLQQGL